MKVIGSMIKKMEMEFIIMLKLEIVMKVIGKTMLNMDMVNIDMVMVICIQAIIYKAKNMVEVNSLGKMAMLMKVIGKKMLCMVKDNYCIKMVKSEMLDFKTIQFYMFNNLFNLYMKKLIKNI